MLTYLKDIYFDTFDIKKAFNDYKKEEDYVNSYDPDYTPAGVAFNTVFTDKPRLTKIAIARTVKFIENGDKVKFDIKFHFAPNLEVVHDHELEKFIEYFKSILSEDDAVRYFNHMTRKF